VSAQPRSPARPADGSPRFGTVSGTSCRRRRPVAGAAAVLGGRHGRGSRRTRCAACSFGTAVAASRDNRSPDKGAGLVSLGRAAAAAEPRRRSNDTRTWECAATHRGKNVDLCRRAQRPRPRPPADPHQPSSGCPRKVAAARALPGEARCADACKPGAQQSVRNLLPAPASTPERRRHRRPEASCLTPVGGSPVRVAVGGGRSIIALQQSLLGPAVVVGADLCGRRTTRALHS